MNDGTSFFVQVKGCHINNVVCMLVLGFISKEMYYGRISGFYVCVCAEVSSYLYLYEDVGFI